MTHPRIYSANVRPESLLAAGNDAGWGGGGRREIRERANIWVRLGVAPHETRLPPRTRPVGVFGEIITQNRINNAE